VGVVVIKGQSIRDDGDVKRRKSSPRELTQLFSWTVLGIALVTLVVLPTPYVVQSPGKTLNVLAHDGEDSDQNPINISDEDVEIPDGELRLTTVSVTGGEGFPTFAANILGGYFSKNSRVLPAEVIFPPDLSQEEIAEENQLEMQSSQDRAVVVALESLGYDLPTTLRIAGTVPGTGSDGVLKQDDVLVAIDGQDLENFAALDDYLNSIEGGDEVTITVERAGQEEDLQVTTSAQHGKTALGVLIDPEIDYPFDVDINAQDIGGPSAGLIFSLGIVDLLTPGSLTGGESISGTGTIDLAGNVGPIGGIEQKLFGADEAGSDWFLAPEANCAEIENQPDGLTVIPVDTFDNAQLAVESIASGQGDSLPTCESTIEDADEAP